MEDAVRALFARYEEVISRALAGAAVTPAELAALYSSEVIGAGPAGVREGKNDADFHAALIQGYAHYREIGTRAMRIRDLHMTPIDTHHSLARVGWSATYARPDLPEVTVDFDVHYMIQCQDGTARVFGWIAGDEEAHLRDRGVLPPAD